MEKKLDYHDALINKVEFFNKKDELHIGIETYEGKGYELCFSEIIGWDFSPFEFQNYLLDFRIYDSCTLDHFIIDNYEVDPEYIKLMKINKGYLFELDPAAGMGGYIIAKGFNIKPLYDNS